MKRIAAALVGLLVAALAPTSYSAAQQTAPPQNVSWQSAGDSYSSGEGTFGNRGDCAQSDNAYGPRAAALLKNDFKWGFASTTFTACTGHLIEDYFNDTDAAADKTSLWDWSREQGGPERVDIITMSFGGNDIGFSDIIKGCLVVGQPESWAELVASEMALGATLGPMSSLVKPSGCDESETDLNARADALLDPTQVCSGYRKDGPYGCDLDIGGRRGSIIDFYYDIVTQRLTGRGRLFVVGYPRIFADTDQWPLWDAIACQGVKRGDTQKLGRAAEHFNIKLQEAVRRANVALGSERILYIDRFASYKEGQHELCGRGEDWLNGVSADRGNGFNFRLDTSFHPNAPGHENTAIGLAQLAREKFLTGVPLTFKNLNMTLPDGWSVTPDGPFVKVRPAGCASATCEAWLGGTDVIATGNELGPWAPGKAYYPATDSRCGFPMVRETARPLSDQILDQGGRPVGDATAAFQRQVDVCTLDNGTTRTTDVHTFFLPSSQILILDATGANEFEAALASATLAPPAPAAASALEATQRLSAAIRTGDAATAAIYADSAVIKMLAGTGKTPPNLADGRCGPPFFGDADCSTWLQDQPVQFNLKVEATSHGWRATKATFIHTT